MTKLNLRDRIARRGSRPETPRIRSTRSILVRLGLLALLMTFALGNRDCREGAVATIFCGDVPIQVAPGTCTPFQNPCGLGGWRGRQGFLLYPTHEQSRLFDPYLLTTRVDGEITRSICVKEGAPSILEEPIAFTYTSGTEGRFGRGFVVLTVATALSIEVTALPSTISFGNSSQLVASVSGGTLPYFYVWAPSSTLDDNDIAAPIAKPRATTTYMVGVTDSIGQHIVGAVTVYVREQLTVTVHPESIQPGETAQLEALAQGGSPPYTFTWTPAEGLDDPHRADPLARPATTTTYNVTATDSTGATLNGSATVVVAGEPLSADAVANPSSINLGETSQLDVLVTGGVLPYTYVWNELNPVSSLSDPLSKNPVASPEVTTIYSVTVTDSVGSTAVDNVTVTVASSPPPTASFVFNVLCCPTLHLDASASTGNIVSYTWDLGWTATSPDRVTSSPLTSFTIQEFNRGTIQLTVTDASGRTATMTRNF